MAPPTPLPIRLKLILWLEAHLKAMKIGTQPPWPSEGWQYTIAFSEVQLGPLGQADTRKRSVCGIVVGRESNNPLFPLDQKKLPVAIEFRLTRNQGDLPPAVEAELMLAQVQRRLHEDTTFGDLAVDFREVWNEINIDSYSDKTVEGVVMMELLYRHHSLDPHIPV